MSCVSRLGDHIEAYLVAREKRDTAQRESFNSLVIEAAEKELAWRLQVLNAMPGSAVHPDAPPVPSYMPPIPGGRCQGCSTESSCSALGRCCARGGPTGDSWRRW